MYMMHVGGGCRRDAGDVDYECDARAVDVDDVGDAKCKGCRRCYVDDMKTRIWQQFFGKTLRGAFRKTCEFRINGFIFDLLIRAFL